ncbi:MAG: thioredoxin [Bacteroidales bacterium]|jgi:thioredoxin 1|nr:thioredoxin [Bacteroidales bacterium]
MALEITDATFDEVVMKEEKLVVLDFWAQWCGPCRQIAPYIEELAKEYEGKAVIGKVDVDNNNGITAKYGIRNIPTVIFMKKGVVVEKLVGANPKATFAQTIEKHL